MQALSQRRTNTIRLVLLAALLITATAVLLLLGVGTASGQGEEEEETFFDCTNCILEFCSHPGGSRHADGSWLDGDPIDGDLISIHPTFGDYTEAIASGGTWSNQAWGMFVDWNGILWQHQDGTCSVRASFRINGVVAEVDYWPCPVKTDRTSPIGSEVWSVRIWMNRSKVEDELDIECTAESPAVPIEDQGPPPGQDTTDSSGTTQPTQTTTTTTTTTTTQTPSTTPTTPTVTPPSDKEDETPTQSTTPSTTNNNPSPSNNGGTSSSTSTTSTPSSSTTTPSQADAEDSDPTDESESQAQEPQVSDDRTEEDLLEEETTDNSSDLMELADEEAEEDLMEQAGTTTSSSDDDPKPQESEATTQTTRPRVPRTGTGGAADSQSEDGLSRGLAPFVASVAAIGIVSLALYRRLRRAQSR